MPAQISVSSDALAGFCRAYAVWELAIFGSLAKGEERADSDVDVLIGLRSDARIGLVALQRMQAELAALFGRPVDLVTRARLNRHIRDEVLGEARVLYAEGETLPGGYRRGDSHCRALDERVRRVRFPEQRGAAKRHRLLSTVSCVHGQSSPVALLRHASLAMDFRPGLGHETWMHRLAL